MKLDRRYKYHQAINNFAPGLFAPITTLFALDRGMSLYQVGIFFGCFCLLLSLPLKNTISTAHLSNLTEAQKKQTK
jgi:hypothetical protein